MFFLVLLITDLNIVYITNNPNRPQKTRRRHLLPEKHRFNLMPGTATRNRVVLTEQVRFSSPMLLDASRQISSTMNTWWYNV
eukprot:gene13493-biopygen44